MEIDFFSTPLFIKTPENRNFLRISIIIIGASESENITIINVYVEYDERNFFLYTANI